VLFGAGLGVGSALMFARGYREDRVSGFLDPWNDPAAHQLRQSLIAFGSGGIWGQGLGASRQKFLFLPYGESDMIFAIIAEELGLVGAAMLVLVYVFLFTRCYRIAMRCPDVGGSLLAAGCTTLLAIQTVINMGVATGLMPTTGQTLPFISFGSTSIVVCLAVIGLILNISRSCN
jgi:cell division protein FtsW